MKTFLKIIANVSLFAVLFIAFMYGVTRFGSFEVYNEQGERVSMFPFSTETVVKEQVAKTCGVNCKIVRVK